MSDETIETVNLVVTAVLAKRVRRIEKALVARGMNPAELRSGKSSLEAAKAGAAKAKDRQQTTPDGARPFPVFTMQAQDKPQQGERGLQGPRGASGEAGKQGPKGDPGPAPEHEISGSKVRFKNPDGTWGQWVKAPKGDKGADGKTGRDGVSAIIRAGSSSGVDLGDLLPGAANVEPSGVVLFQGGKAVNLPWSAFLSVIAGAVDMGSDVARRENFVGENLLYRGEAAPGSIESAPVWKIRRLAFGADGDVTTTFANGNAEFAHVWADRETFAYV